ncbi:hypothetical protein BGX34_003161 [Mortierella sp. NVP85]|nr:hypothetical protein BGX34_003161 [Mortierella sp. NVP85]
MLNKMRPKLDSMKEQHQKILKEKSNELAGQLKTLEDLQSMKQILKNPSTARNMDLEGVKEEIKTTHGDIETMERGLLFAVLPKGLVDEANAILEIRAGALRKSNVGSDAMINISGSIVFGHLKYETGDHRTQRVRLRRLGDATHQP